MESQGRAPHKPAVHLIKQRVPVEAPRLPAVPESALPEEQGDLRPPDPNDPALLERQIKVYDLRVSGMSVHGIASTLGIPRESVIEDIRIESGRRQGELKGGRMSHVAMAVARYEGIIMRAQTRIGKMKQAEASGSKGATRFAFLEDKVILEAQKRIDALLGLVAVKAKTGDEDAHAPPSLTALGVLETLASLPPDMRTQALAEAAERRRKQGMKNVTPR